MTFDPNPISVLDRNNSTTTELSDGAEFIGEPVDMRHYSAVSVEAYTDQDSADLGLEIQFSQTGKTGTWDNDQKFTVSANTQFYQSLPRFGRYMRVKYTNGSTAQTTFRLQTMVDHQPTQPYPMDYLVEVCRARS